MGFGRQNRQAQAIDHYFAQGRSTETENQASYGSSHLHHSPHIQEATEAFSLKLLTCDPNYASVAMDARVAARVDNSLCFEGKRGNLHWYRWLFDLLALGAVQD